MAGPAAPASSSTVGVKSTTWTRRPATASVPHRNRNADSASRRPPVARPARMPAGIARSMTICSEARLSRLADGREDLAQLGHVALEVTDHQPLCDVAHRQVAARDVATDPCGLAVIERPEPVGDSLRLDVDPPEQLAARERPVAPDQSDPDRVRFEAPERRRLRP